jgi:uncharacterized protein GlcG (DUF336 family)
MRRTGPWLVVAFIATGAFAAPRRQAVARPPAVDAGPPCVEGAIGDGAPQSFAALTVAEVQAIVTAAAGATNADAATIAVVDRAGRVLALHRAAHATGADDDRAVGLARTAAFFSHNQAPLSSRTVRFLSGVHFPPGVENASNAALYGIENTNRGCSLNTPFNAGKDVPPATSAAHPGPCNASDTTGCGPGIVTGKQQPDDGPYPQSVGNRRVDAGGIPLYRLVAPGLDRIHEGVVSNGKLIGGIGVAGIPGDPRIAEYAAATGAFGAPGIVPVPFYTLPDPGNVFVDGIRLPFLDPHARLRFNDEGLPIGLEAPEGVQAGSSAAGTFVIAATAGGCADNEYLAGPHGGALTAAQVDGIVQRAIAAAKRTRGIIRLPLNSYARMVIAVTDLDGTVLALYRMPDATVFSIDVAVAKARNMVWFSSDPRDLPGIPAGTVVTNRTIGFGAQPLFPPGIEQQPGPFYPLFTNDLAHACTQGSDASHPQNQNGIVFFPGATPLYANGKLVGGLGVSGDGVEQDDYVTYLAAGSFLPDPKQWADQIKVDGVRLPMFKFPRQPECKPCS